jgi:hypothetical protein
MTMSDINVADTNTPSVEVPRFRDAYDHLIDEIRAVPDSDLIIVNIDIPTSVTTALGALPEIVALRPRVVSEMPNYDIVRFDKLEAYTLAVGHAHALFLAASTPTESIDELSSQAVATREMLFSDASALAKRNLVDRQRLSELKGANGYRNTAFDVMALAAMLRDAWPNIVGKTALELSELDRAEMLADRLLTAVGLRDQGPAIIAEASENRQKAFTLFVSAYDYVRRAVSFLRWSEEDVERIAPSLYAGRGTGRRKPTDPQPPVPPPVASPPVPPAAPVSAAPAKVGHPESAPFVAR